MEQVTTIGLDIAKHLFQVHGAPPGGAVLQLSRGDGVTNRIFDIDKFLVVATELSTPSQSSYAVAMVIDPGLLPRSDPVVHRIR